MSLEVEDASSRVKLKLRSMFLNKAADLFKAKGIAEEAAAAKARVTELQLYRASKDRDEYKDKAVKVFANLKKQEADDLAASRPRDADDDSPVAKKQKVEGEDGAAAVSDANSEGGVDAKPESATLVLTGDKTRDKVRTRIAAALKLVPERDRTAINKVRSGMQKGPLCEYEVAAAVEDEMHRVLTGAPAPSVPAPRPCPRPQPWSVQLTASGAQTRRLTRHRRGIYLRTSTRQTTRPFDCAC